MITAPVLAFGFGSWAMLGWLAAAALPLVIHLLNRRQYREVSWAAIDFLLSALRKNSRRLRLEQWLLLAVRTALIMVVVLALAGPYLEQLPQIFTAGERTHRVLVIDGSYSMAFRPADRSRFEKAQQLARQIVEHSHAGDGFTLVLMASPPRVIVGTPAFDRDEIISEIDGLKLLHGGADLSESLTRVEELLETARSERPELRREEVYFLSDLGQTTWGSGAHGAEPARQELKARAARLGESAQLTVIDLGQADAENVAVTSLRVLDPVATTTAEVTLQATVRNFGRETQRPRVQLLLDGQAARQTTLELAAGREQTLTFTHRFDAPGNHVAEVRTSGDGLEVDNHRYAAIPVKEHLRVLCVDGKPRTADTRGATHYLERALDPERGQGTLSPARVTVIPESSLSDTDLAAYDCVLLANVGQFTSAESRQLHDYLDRGGGLVFFLGDRVSPDRYNQELAGEMGPRVLPVRMLEQSVESQYTFDPLGYEHSLLDAYRGVDAAGLERVPTLRYMRLEIPAGSKAREALRFRGTGDPAIVEEPIGRGRVIVVATSVSVDRNPWSALPLWDNWPPLAQALLRSAVGRPIERRNIEVGGVVEIPLAPSAGKLEVSTPGGGREIVRTAEGSTAHVVAFGDTRISGVYSTASPTKASAADAASSLAAFRFAVNLDTRESDLEKIDPSELPEGFSARAQWQDLDEESAQSVVARGGLHRGLLIAALVLLAAELLLAWWYGRGLR